jgi:hypothetical protein
MSTHTIYHVDDIQWYCINECKPAEGSTDAPMYIVYEMVWIPAYVVEHMYKTLQEHKNGSRSSSQEQKEQV